METDSTFSFNVCSCFSWSVLLRPLTENSSKITLNVILYSLKFDGFNQCHPNNTKMNIFRLIRVKFDLHLLKWILDPPVWFYRILKLSNCTCHVWVYWLIKVPAWSWAELLSHWLRGGCGSKTEMFYCARGPWSDLPTTALNAQSSLQYTPFKVFWHINSLKTDKE